MTGKDRVAWGKCRQKISELKYIAYNFFIFHSFEKKFFHVQLAESLLYRLVKSVSHNLAVIDIYKVFFEDYSAILHLPHLG